MCCKYKICDGSEELTFLCGFRFWAGMASPPHLPSLPELGMVKPCFGLTNSSCLSPLKVKSLLKRLDLQWQKDTKWTLLYWVINTETFSLGEDKRRMHLHTFRRYWRINAETFAFGHVSQQQTRDSVWETSVGLLYNNFYLNLSTVFHSIHSELKDSI